MNIKFRTELSFLKGRKCRVEQIHGRAFYHACCNIMQCFRELSVFAARGLSIPVVVRYLGGAGKYTLYIRCRHSPSKDAYSGMEMWWHTFLTSELCRGEDSGSHSGRVKPTNETVFNNWIGECVGFGPNMDAIEYDRTGVSRITVRSPVMYRFPYLEFWVLWLCTCKCVAATCAH